MNEFELYCRQKSTEDIALLEPVRNFIISELPNAAESRVHFFLVYHYGPIPVVKLHLTTKGIRTLSFINGSELNDPNKVLKGKNLVRTVKIGSDQYFEKNKDAIADLLKQSEIIVKSRWDGKGQMIVLKPDQFSP